MTHVHSNSTGGHSKRGPAIISRKDAKAAGLRVYFSGIPCPLGHVSERLVSNYNCAECDRVRVNPNKNAEYQPDESDGNCEGFKTRQRVYKVVEKRRAQIRTIFNEYRDQGLILNLRALFYQFVTRGYEVNTFEAYVRIGDTLRNGRMEGKLDWDMIEDRSRVLHDMSHWSSPARLIEAAGRQYSIDYWRWQDIAPFVWIEKEALVGVIANVCEELRLPYHGLHGFNSVALNYLFTKRFQQIHAEGRTPVVFHLGDHDPAGLAATKSIRGILDTMRCPFVEVVRLGLNKLACDGPVNQIKKYKLIPNEIKDEEDSFNAKTGKWKDTRMPAYIDKYGPAMWELDALPPQELVALIRDGVEARIDWDEWESAKEREQDGRDAIAKIAKHKSLK